MATADDQTTTSESSEGSETQPPAQRPPEVAAMAVELSRLQRLAEDGAKKLAEAKAERDRLASELSGVRAAAKRGRIVNSIQGEFASPTALEAMATHVWDDVVGKLQRADGQSEADFEAAQAKALRDHLAGIDNGALLKRQTTDGGGDINQGARHTAPRSIYSIPRGRSA